MTAPRPPVVVRHTGPQDIDPIIALCRRVYPESEPWRRDQLESHQRVFGEGQFVAVDPADGRVLGMAASLVIRWRSYKISANWRDFTAHGMFTNHNPTGRTLYGAEVIVDPAIQRRGVGSALYTARRALVERLGLLRIRAGARLRGYHKHAAKMSAPDYVIGVVHGRLHDPTLSFQIRHGFEVIAVVESYLRKDPESLGWAAVIEWLNPAVARPGDSSDRDRRYIRNTGLPPGVHPPGARHPATHPPGARHRPSSPPQQPKQRKPHE